MNRAKLLTNRDKLMNAPSEKVAEATVLIFDRIQGLPKYLQLLALACAFLLVAETSGIPAQDAFTASKNLMVDPSTKTGLGLRFQAMKHHLATEVLSGREYR
jgi:hypothetical protein